MARWSSSGVATAKEVEAVEAEEATANVVVMTNLKMVELIISLSLLMILTVSSQILMSTKIIATR